MLNHYGLGLYVESWLKSLVISGLPGLWELKYRNLIALVIVFCTYVLMIWSVLLQVLCNTLMKHMKHGLETKATFHLFFHVSMPVMLGSCVTNVWCG